MSKKHEFRLMNKGFDHYTDLLENENQQLKNTLANYEEEIAIMKAEYLVLKGQYDALVSDLDVKQKAAEEISRLTIKEANVIIETAKCNADSLIREALSSARCVLTQLSQLSQKNKENDFLEIEQLLKDMDDFKQLKLPVNS